MIKIMSEEYTYNDLLLCKQFNFVEFEVTLHKCFLTSNPTLNIFCNFLSKLFKTKSILEEKQQIVEKVNYEAVVISIVSNRRYCEVIGFVSAVFFAIRSIVRELVVGSTSYDGRISSIFIDSQAQWRQATKKKKKAISDSSFKGHYR